MRSGRGLPAAAAVIFALACASAAQAADPGRWVETGKTTTPIYYYQGVTSDPARNFYFDGVHVGLYRTDSDLNETARKDDAIPPAVHASENYNHIGDLTWDAREGGRLLLPVECYYPPAGNTCNTGSFGVADPRTLEWRYYVKADAELPKAMWAEVSPDGELVWTSVERDLLAYRAADINPANAAPAGPRIKAVKRMKNVVPPSGVTGAAFFRGRLYVAGSEGRKFQIWSLDLSTGARRLEIERTVVGESEGIDAQPALGGELHWLIQPYNEESIPTYGVTNGTLLHFVPRGSAGAGSPSTRRRDARRPRLALKVRPRRVRAGRRCASASGSLRATRVRAAAGWYGGERSAGWEEEADQSPWPRRAEAEVLPPGALPRSGLEARHAQRGGLDPGPRAAQPLACSPFPWGQPISSTCRMFATSSSAALGLPSNQPSRISSSNASLVPRSDSASTLASFHLRAPRAVSASAHNAARTPATLLAAIDAPVPVQQATTA